jgi:hypothetical protein
VAAIYPLGQKQLQRFPVDLRIWWVAGAQLATACKTRWRLGDLRVAAVIRLAD